MSSILEHINKNPQETQRLIGLEYDELQILIQNAEKLHQEKQALLESQKIRIISGGGGRKPKLSTQEQILLTVPILDFGLEEELICSPLLLALFFFPNLKSEIQNLKLIYPIWSE